MWGGGGVWGLGGGGVDGGRFEHAVTGEFSGGQCDMETFIDQAFS